NKYNPTQWADLIKQSGARYAVLTAKHHDGVALWDTKQQGLSVVKNTPAKRDLIGPYIDALRNLNIKTGLYYSLIDWSHPDYDIFTRTQKRYTNDSLRWKKFTGFYQAQLQELSTKYNPDLYWFDGDWEHTAAEWQADKVRKMLMYYNKNVIINSRLTNHGDYATPEQGVPIQIPKDYYWELCYTMNDSWGYQPNDTHYKSCNQILNVLVDCIYKGGNLLLDIGPKADGTIDEKQKQLLVDVGRWTKKHEAAVFGTLPGINTEYCMYPTALSADSNMLYVFVSGKPASVYIKGLNNKVHRAYVLGQGTMLSYDIFGKAYWNKKPGMLSINLPQQLCDNEITVIAILLDGPVSLYND
ncbi:MAG TPA: alpha-L-fucosidase, partial [Bacteroidia bacterium]|nr:alpha-L-fucosidase [Bacteroidia bacterium]